MLWNNMNQEKTHSLQCDTIKQNACCIKSIRENISKLFCSPRRRCLCSGKELWPHRFSVFDLHSGWCPEAQQDITSTLISEYSDATFKHLFERHILSAVNSTYAYPLSNLSLVTKRQQINVGLQRAGINHSFVPLKNKINHHSSSLSFY